jgi:hypothetical protein
MFAFQFSCSETEGLIVHIQNKSHRCYQANQIIQVQAYTTEWLHDGTIVCPNCTEVCQVRDTQNLSLVPLEIVAAGDGTTVYTRG